MYYLSKYNCYLENKDTVLVYNTKFENVVSFESENKESVKHYLLTNPTDELIEMGFVCDHPYEIEEEKYSFQQLKHAKGTLNIMLIMTYKCNCKCTYCFENLTSDLLNECEEDVDGVLQAIIDMYQNGKYNLLELHFFGGEPTLESQKMVYIMQRLKDAGINVAPNIISNGVCLNEQKIQEFTKSGINSIQITIDGEKELHDKRRPAKDGSSSWEHIMHNILLLIKADFGVTVRINLDKENVNSLKTICDCIPPEALQHKYFHIYIAPIVGCLTKSNAVETLEERAENLKKAWEIIAAEKLPIAITPPVYYPCPIASCESAFYIDLHGNIYNCGGFVGKKDKIERTIHTKTLSFYDRTASMPADKCFQCEYSPICRGGCTFEKSELGIDCQYFYLKEVYDEYYSKYAE